MRYVGPRYILVNHTNDCMCDVDSSWLDGDILEGHPCVKSQTVNETRVVPLTALKNNFHVDYCLRNFQPSSSDIQVKRANGFFRIYCYGHKIKIEGIYRDCPLEVFELPITTTFVLNGHHNKVQ